MPEELLKSIRNISVPEGKLLDAIDELRFGEIYGAQLTEAEFTKERWLSEEEWRLINFIRLGNYYIDILIVHMGMPRIACQDLKIGDFKCQRKTKFST